MSAIYDILDSDTTKRFWLPKAGEDTRIRFLPPLEPITLYKMQYENGPLKINVLKNRSDCGCIAAEKQKEWEYDKFRSIVMAEAKTGL